jgi:hypothetical protein
MPPPKFSIPPLTELKAIVLPATVSVLPPK